MSVPQIYSNLPPTHSHDLERAYAILERPNFAEKLADYAGKPLNRVIDIMPDIARRRLNRIVEKAMLDCLKVAVDSMDEEPAAPSRWMSSALAGISGALGGAVGLAALPIELPVTTTLMLRSIADIARHEGEDLSQLSARMACLEVFALGAHRTKGRTDIGYYAARAMLTRLTGDACAILIERGVAGASAPVVNGLVAEVASRFGMVVSDKIAASAVPILGAIGGATVNVLFTEHFQKIADAHFTLRRLERTYGIGVVRDHYARLAHPSAHLAV